MVCVPECTVIRSSALLYEAGSPTIEPPGAPQLLLAAELFAMTTRGNVKPSSRSLCPGSLMNRKRGDGCKGRTCQPSSGSGMGTHVRRRPPARHQRDWPLDGATPLARLESGNRHSDCPFSEVLCLVHVASTQTAHTRTPDQQCSRATGPGRRSPTKSERPSPPGAAALAGCTR